MVTVGAAFDVVRAAHPTFRGPHDGIAFAAHAIFRAAGYSLCAVGPVAFAKPLPSGDKEVGIDGWNSMEKNYAFLYNKEKKGKKKRVWVRCLVMGDLLAIGALDLEGQEEAPYNVQINVKDFFSEIYPKTYNEMYKNFPSLIEKIISNVLSKLDGKAGAVVANETDAESSSRIQIQSSEIELISEMYPRPRTTEPSGYPGSYPSGYPGPWNTDPSGLVYPPIVPLGFDDLYPHSGIGGGGSMHVQMIHAAFLLIPPHLVALGGRYDPIGPPDVPGFEPSRFVRHPGGSTHPDLEFFQHGPDL